MEIDIRAAVETHRQRLKNIRLFVADVDGILTDGKIWWDGEEVGWNRSFNVLDGWGLKFLMRSGIEVGIISAGNSLGLKKRVEILGIKHAYYGDENKLGSFLDLCSKTGIGPEQALYIGDEPYDADILKRVGFAATVPHAVWEVKGSCHYITQRKAGDGCARELVEMIRMAQELPLLSPQKLANP